MQLSFIGCGMWAAWDVSVSYVCLHISIPLHRSSFWEDVLRLKPHLSLSNELLKSYFNSFWTEVLFSD